MKLAVCRWKKVKFLNASGSYSKRAPEPRAHSFIKQLPSKLAVEELVAAYFADLWNPMFPFISWHLIEANPSIS